MSIIVSERSINTSESMHHYGPDGKATHINHYESMYITEEIPVDDELVNVDISFDLYKSKSAEQLVSGWANVSINADGSIPLDWHDDVITPQELEKAAVGFMLNYRDSGVMHEGDSVGTVVESIVFTKEKQEALGIPEGTVHQGWFITVKVHDAEVYKKVEDGTYKMFSIQGTCRRSKI